MNEKEFWECKFIENGLKFYTKEEVLKDKKAIWYLYQKLTPNEKYLYRWYVYAHPNIGYKFKGRLWDYLNNYQDELEY